ncbi:MAG TPA: HlyD family secretion protein [Thermoanaerobaculia bacterium]|nr:HlyD family secretion protein [Thermoanaerobaculia bacterium]
MAQVIEQQSPPRPAEPVERLPAAPQEPPPEPSAPSERSERSEVSAAQAPPVAGGRPAGSRVSPRLRRIAFAAALILALGGVLYWLHARNFEDTDDAEVDGHLHPISARVNGTVVAVNPTVQENRFVAAGTLLVEIDPADLQAEVNRAQAEVERLRASAAASRAEVPVVAANATGQLRAAQAALAEAHHGVATERANVDAARSRVEQAQANFTRSEADRQRYANLLEKQEISRSEYDLRLTEARNAQAALAGARAEVAAAEHRVSQAESKVALQEADLAKARTAPEQIAGVRERSGSAGAEVARAEAQLEAARLNLAYTRIVAPVSGVVGKKTAESGQRVQPGQELLTIIQLDDVWVTANFKETQLRLFRPGQPATVHVDAYGIDLPGHVESIAAATGARFSLLPPENASGNFVKVVQRLPVRIRFDRGQDPQHLLRPGMSVLATVRVR